jgi:hypothetical protein
MRVYSLDAIAMPLRHGEILMLTSTVELLAGLCLEAVILLIASSIVASIVAALGAISRGQSGDVQTIHAGSRHGRVPD